MKVWIFLPAYNEAESLRRLLPKIRGLSEVIGYEVKLLILDDGSDDETSSLVKEECESNRNVILLSHEYNRGLGETERDGFEFLARETSDADVIVRLDCDDTHEPMYIKPLIEQLGRGFDVVNTSRFQSGGYQKGVNWYRRAISRSANIFMKILFNIKGLRDYSCGFRIYKAGLIKDAVKIYGNSFLQTRSFGFSSTLEIIVKLDLLGARFSEVPFGLRYDQKVTDSKMVSSMTMLGYFVMAILYHYPRSGWRKWKKILAKEKLKSVDLAGNAFSRIRASRSIPSRFGS